MQTTHKFLSRLSFFATVAVVAVFSVQAIILNTLNPSETVTALSITSITSNVGPTSGNELVTITGYFGTQVYITQISAGRDHSLALDSTGQIWAWGVGGAGQLGNGTNENSNVPVEVDTTGVLANRQIIQVSAGGIHSLALDSEGNVFAWGMGLNGQLGNGVSESSNVPVEVDMTGVLAGNPIIQISAGLNYSLALSESNRVFSWGLGMTGQLGNGGNDNHNTPVEVLDKPDIIQISAGANHALALSSDGAVFAWGLGIGGQLGNGINTSSNVPVPVGVPELLSGIIQVSAGLNYSLALSEDGSIFAWGVGGFGQLGNGVNTPSNIPVLVDLSSVPAERNMVQISAGWGHSLALDSTGQIWAWGLGIGGQLGNGTNESSNTPVAVNMSEFIAKQDIVQISAGGSFSLALDSAGNVFAWGLGIGGQLGNDTNENTNIPVFSFGLNTPHITSITLGGLPCTDIQIINPTTVTCITPVHPAGVVDVTVTTVSGSVTLYQSYTFIDLPDVPNTGHERI
ncbi:IPT/TIG domain-containing protein [Candidatus Saccharibacteria bacterium]|nr:IPT/TIG domain-containing protein [Candidatus Saccharibacteria bacterium]